MNTKERILNISLELFSKHGFSGVSVRDIAKKVGVRESALYKHFKNKQDIFDSIIVVMKERISLAYQENQLPEVMTENISNAYENLSVKHICEIAWKLFLLYTKDPMVSSYRKLLMREQFCNEQAAKQYDEIYLSGVIRRQGKVFEKLVEGGFFIDENPEVIAMEFYGPILLLFQQYDCNPENEELLKNILFRHVKAFGENYRKDGIKQ
jgi:AcrR family transcriptional regulator